MLISPPVAAVQAGATSGGGLLDSFKNMISGASGAAATGTAQAPQQGDGSVGLFDGVLKKAAMGGMVGVGVGLIPFLPGGWLLGGIVGALGGAALGVYSNWKKMNEIKAQNAAMLAAMGVQVNDPQVQQILQSGNVEQLIPLVKQAQAEQQASLAANSGAGTGAGTPSQGTVPVQQGPVIVEVVNPETGEKRQVDITTGQVVQQGDAVQTPTTAPAATTQQSSVVDPAATPGQSPIPTQGSTSQGGGAVDGADAGVAAMQLEHTKALIDQIQRQIDMLKEYLAKSEARRAAERAAA